MGNQYVYDAIRQWMVKNGSPVSRAQVANQFGTSKQTSIVHLEKLVEQGRAVKYYGWITQHNRGWLYYPIVNDKDSDGEVSVSETQMGLPF